MLDRRRFLITSLAAGAALSVVPAANRSGAAAVGAAAGNARLWSDASRWPARRVPGRSDHVVVEDHVVLDGDAEVASLMITNTGTVELAPRSTVTLLSHGNVVVRGRFVARPASAQQLHTLRFPSVREASFVGGHAHDAVASDVGLWVLGAGALELVGTARAGWNRTGTDPSWLPGDDVRVAPNAPRDFTNFRAFTPGSPVPSMDRDGVAHRSEVFNLTRNVVVEGRPGGRAHVLITSSVRQTIRHVALRHLGPRKRNGDHTALVLGRYGLHFHHSGDGSRGTVVEGVVVAHCGNRAFVPHRSHGITFRDCIAFDGVEDGFWWDADSRTTYPNNASHDVTYEHCAVFGLRPDPVFRGYTLAGFALGQGERNRCSDCVVVGNLGNKSASGFQWPESAGHVPNLWQFEGCVAHNNRANGIYVWQNDANKHVVSGFVAYRNGGSGVEHGAYVNDYRYKDSALFENGAGALTLHAQSRTGASWDNLDLDGGGAADHVLVIAKHKLEMRRPTRFTGCRLRGWKKAPVLVAHTSGSQPGAYDFVGTRVGPQGRDLEPGDFLLAKAVRGTVIRVQRQNRTAYRLDHTGRVTSIPAFA